VTAPAVALGLRANASQFWLLVALNALVGGMVGLERSVLPLVGEQDFGVDSKTAVLSFIAGFGAAKAVANLVAGRLADRHGRKRVLVAGWLLALPVPLLVGVAPSWSLVVAANLLLGASQGLAWSMTLLMKVDLAGPVRRGLALGLNESAGYVGVALTAAATGAFAAEVAPRTLIWSAAAALAAAGTAASVLLVRETRAHVELEERGWRAETAPGTVVSASQAGFVNNLNDAVAWGLAPLYLASAGASAAEIGVFAGLYPAVWGTTQLGFGALSDRIGRGPLIAVGMLTQAGALGLLAAVNGQLGWSLTAAVLLGLGTALVYPTLLAAVSDAVAPVRRARAFGIYRFWRDAGLVAGALLAGVVTDAVDARTALAAVAAITALSGVWTVLAKWPSVATTRAP
jgi:MFS family permease